MQISDIDERAKKILFGTYWASTGWRSDRNITAGDFEYAKSKGLMFEPVTMSHDQQIEYAIHARDAVYASDVVSAFVASLSSRRLDLRSGLGSYAVARHLQVHVSTEHAGTCACRICGVSLHSSEVDLNVLNFERFKWGGVRHDQPAYIGLDLSRLSKLGSVRPSDADYLMLTEILASARKMPNSGRLKDLSKALAGVFPSNEYERRTLISILGYSGILADPERLDYRTAFPICDQREYTSYAKDDWPYPVRWWTGSIGVNEEAVADWFPSVAGR